MNAATAHERANQLAQRIVTAYVPPHGPQLAIETDPRRGVGSARLAAQRLPRPERGKRRLDQFCIRRCGRTNSHGRARYVVKIFHAAEPATGMAAQLPYAPGCEIAMQIGAFERNIDRDPVLAWHDRDIRKVGSSRYD